MLCRALQTSEVSRLKSQLQSAAGQRQQLEQQMSTLTQQMSSMVAGLGQFMQQQVRGLSITTATMCERSVAGLEQEGI